MNISLDKTFSTTTIGIAVGVLAFYITWLYTMIGFRLDHFNFILIVSTLYFAHKTTRKMVVGFIFFWIFWFIYDAMRIYPNYNVNPIHIIEPYNLEKAMFAITSDGVKLTPNEYLANHPNKISDLLSGFFYLTWVPVPMMYCIYLFFTDKKTLLIFSATFLITNIIGFTIYYLYPAAAPWYIEHHGTEIDFTIQGEAAQLLRFDNIIGYPLFEKMYNKNANVFAAIPSLHSAYPVILYYFAKKKKITWLTVLCIIEILGIWYAAVYSMHHYIIDVLLGAFCAIIAIFAANISLKNKKLQQFIDKYAQFIA